MRLKTLVLCSSSMLVAVASAPAWAQTTPTGSAPTEPVQTESVPNDPDAAAPQQEDAVEGEGEEIVVTGLRRSLQSAQQLKRNSDQIVDAIVAEDIGKLPDLAVSETAARIPGVQVTRRFGEADSVLIRGLPDFATTYNGREIFTAETRVVALQDFPSGNIAALEIFKTSTASLVEAGLAGLVNVRSRRPFDFKGLEAAGSVWGLYTRQAGKVTPNGNFLLSNRWETGAGEFGALVNVSYTELQFLDSEPSNTDFLATPDINGPTTPGGVIRFPDIHRLFYAAGNRVRPSFNAALQWRPAPGIELYVDALYQGFRNKISDRLLEVPLFGGQYSNLVFRDGTNVVRSGTNANTPGAIFSFQGGTFNKTDTYQFAVGGSYDAGPLRISADLARTDSTFTGSTESVDRTITGGRTVDFDLDTPQFTIRNFDAADPANYRFDGLYEEKQVSEGDDYQARLDAEYEIDLSFLRSIEAGVRYTDRDAHREFGNRFAGYRPQNIPIAAIPLEFSLFREGFRGTDIQSGTGTFLAPTYRNIRDNREELRRFVIARPRSFGFGTFTEDDPVPNPDSVFDANERTLAGYAQINYMFGDNIDGVVGLRVVDTKSQVDGTSLVQQTDPDGAGPLPAPPAVFTPVSVGQSYTDYLPNASIRFRFTPQVQFRLSATQTRTRPTFAQLNPSASLGPPPGAPSGSTDPFANARRGGGGNPFLQPFTSNNYDASIEYYFSRAGFVSAAVFRRDLEGFIQNKTVQYIDPVLGPLIITGPVNTGKGRIDGAEAQAQTFFDFEFLPEWARGFGAQANVTYLDAETGFPNAAGDFELDRILGVSKWTYNLVGFYERNGLSARLSYNKRGKFLSRRDDRGDDLYTETANPAGRLDLSTNYTVTDKLTVFFDWTNILNNPFRVNFSSARAGADRVEFVRFLRFEENTMSLGARFRF